MKKLLSITLILISVVSMNCSTPEVEAATELKADKALALKVDGMVCEVGCAKYIEKQVAKLDGVSDCSVNFEDGVASIEFSSENTGEEEIMEAITSINDGQYSVTVVKLSELNKSTQTGPQENSKDKSDAKVSIHLPELVTYFLSRVIERV